MPQTPALSEAGPVNAAENLERELRMALIHRGNSFHGLTADGERVLVEHGRLFGLSVD
ncbi:hypothetical protein [Sodalis sp.]|uniref:hypothetical protein n=1 Tax=Sodalis sp. (in: enterobacteria) TaxID=1898979 RepID=UPI003873C343